MSALIDLNTPVGIRSRHVQIATGLNMHILEAGEPDGRPLILLSSRELPKQNVILTGEESMWLPRPFVWC